MRAEAAQCGPPSKVFAMDPNLFITIICIAVSLLILVGVAVMLRRATVRALVWWVGLACLPVGALLAGAVPFLIDGWNRMAEWWQLLMGAPLAPVAMAGLIVLGVGLALMLVSRVIPHRPRKKKTPPSTPGATAVRDRPIYDQTPASETTTT